MKTPLLLAGLALASLLPLQADVAHDISQAAQPSKGAGSLTDGGAYARSLYNIFTQNGVEAYIVNFTWQKETYLPAYQASFVVFRDSQGRYFGQQTNMTKAKWLSGTTPKEWAQSFYSDSFVRVDGVADNRNIVGYRPANRASQLATQ